ncbi:MAG: PfkB family carbohydrate kinase [Caldilineaceae bacterium]|nr:PfkB family carbohydrate kinase [Caldilineaceae bacterium]
MTASSGHRWDLATLGDLVADLIVPIPSLPIEAGRHQLAKWMQLEAGGTCNTLVMAQRLGLRTVAIGVMGEDPVGSYVRSALAEEGVDLTGLNLSPEVRTTPALVFVDDHGEHVFVGSLDRGPHQPFAASWPAIIRSSRTIFVTGYAMFMASMFGRDNVLQGLRLAREADCRIYFDVGPPEYIGDGDDIARGFALTDVVLATAEELSSWTEVSDPFRAARWILEHGPRCVVVKVGADGCHIVAREGEQHCPGFPVRMRDTVGAGDAFAAGFMAAEAAGCDLYEAGMIANAVGAATATKVGTGRLLPQRDQVAELLGTQGLELPDLTGSGAV